MSTKWQTNINHVTMSTAMKIEGHSIICKRFCKVNKVIVAHTANVLCQMMCLNGLQCQFWVLSWIPGRCFDDFWHQLRGGQNILQRSNVPFLGGWQCHLVFPGLPRQYQQSRQSHLCTHTHFIRLPVRSLIWIFVVPSTQPIGRRYNVIIGMSIRDYDHDLLFATPWIGWLNALWKK